MRCPVCDTWNPSGAEECRRCGANFASLREAARGATILFVDVGEEELARGAPQRIGGRFSSLLEVVRDSVEAHHGKVEIIEESDAIAAFSSANPSDAVECALGTAHDIAGSIPEGFVVAFGMHTSRMEIPIVGSASGQESLLLPVAGAVRLGREARPGELLTSFAATRMMEIGRARRVVNPRRRYRLRGLQPRAIDVVEDIPELVTGTSEQEAPTPRYVNVAVARDGEALRASTSLAAETEYTLRVDIGELSLESIVENALEAPFAAEKLPPREEGHWLEAILAGEDADLAGKRHPLFLPWSGPAWTCRCEPGGPHRCFLDSRSPYVFIPFRTREARPVLELRLAVYFERNLVQSQVVRAEVLGEERVGYGHHAHIDYNLTAHLTDISDLEPRTLNIVTNESHDGTHRLIFNGETENPVWLTLAEGQMSSAINGAREALRDIHIYEDRRYSSPSKRYRSRYTENAKKPDEFAADLRRLAELGSLLWEALASEPRMLNVFKKGRLRGHATIQVARPSGNVFVFPWALVYDISLSRGTPTELCPYLSDGEIAGLEKVWPTTCPRSAEHRKNVVCPFGFWGFRHVIEEPPSRNQGDDSKKTIPVSRDGAALVVARTLDLERVVDHVRRMTKPFSNLGIVDCDSQGDFKDALLREDLDLVYLFCHGRRGDVEGIVDRYLEVGKNERVSPGDVLRWYLDWGTQHWEKVAPLVFINGCNTVDLTPDALANFVDSFAAARAAGIIGTEVSVHQPLAAEVAELLFRNLSEKVSPGKYVSVGEALRRTRLTLLAKGNVMGLAYTAFAPSSLRFS